MKLTDNQRSALGGLLARGPSSAHMLKCSLATLHALERRGLIYRRTDTVFAIAFPRNAKWIITDAGRAALAHRSEG